MAKENSLPPCLILISLLFDESYKGKKGTCPSDLAVVLSGRHQHPFCYLAKHVSSSLTTGILSASLCVLICTDETPKLKHLQLYVYQLQ